MKVLVATLAVLAIGLVESSTVTYTSLHPTFISSQYHSQDELGQYSYGYSNSHSSKSEIKTADGTTRGAYSYIDAEGKLQNIEYSSDDINGFRVSGTNLPATAFEQSGTIHQQIVQDTPEVAEAKSKHLAALEEARRRSAEYQTPIYTFATNPAVHRFAYTIHTPFIGFPGISTYNSPLFYAASTHQETHQAKPDEESAKENSKENATH